jgi:1-acyl-sn-glycerol-3-phosphate acyltransferase
MKGKSQFALLRQRRFAPFFVTQMLGAFNDHLYKQAVGVWIAFGVAGLSTAQIAQYAYLMQLLFIGPFLLLSAFAGQLAERFEKSRLIRWIKLFEVAIMTLGAIGFAQHSIPILLAALCLMGVHSTLFGPVKYGILPQQLRYDELVGGNGLIESSTSVVILIGTLFGTALIAHSGGPVAVGEAAILVALLGYIAARFVPPAPATAPDLKLNWNPFSETWRNLAFMRQNRTVFLSVLGISWYWFYGALFLTQLPNYTKHILGGTQLAVAVLLFVFSIGVGLGSLLCERLSGHKVELGLVPLGSIGMTLFGLDIYFAAPLAATVHDMTLAQFVHDGRCQRVMADLALIGIFAGFYIVPLYALVQARSEPSHRSRIIAGNNILNAVFGIVSAFMAHLLLKAGFNIPQVFLVTAVLNAGVAIFIYSLVPEFLMRFLVWILVNTLYRIDARGLDNVPEEGAAVLVCNHVSFVDALIVGGCIRRPVRFVVYHKIYNTPVLNFIFRTAKAIPIAPAREDEALLKQAYERIDAALRGGEIVGIFPEGGLTRDGEMQPFKPGIENILARTPVPVIPAALQNLWGSMWSRRDSRLGRMRLPRRFRARIGLVIDPPGSAAAATAPALEARVRELRGSLA